MLHSPSPSSTATVVIDGFTHNSILTSGDSVPLGTQIILVCWVVGLPYGTPLNYTWTCPNGQCITVRLDKYLYNEHILAVNATFISNGGIYTCRVTATGGQEATGNFTLIVTGTYVCHLALHHTTVVRTSCACTVRAIITYAHKYTEEGCPALYSRSLVISLR